MSTQPSRAEWWREVTDPDEVIQEGRWYRIEYQKEQTVAEHLADMDRPRSDWYEGANVFVDSRWKPPVPPLKVGDAVTSVEQLDALPIKAALVDCGRDIWQKREYAWFLAAAESPRTGSDVVTGYAPLTLIYLPEAGGDE